MKPYEGPTDNDDPRLKGAVEDKPENVKDVPAVEDTPEVDKAEEVPAPIEAPTDAEDAPELSTEALLRRDVWQREMHKVGEARREIQKEREELKELAELRDFLKENPAIAGELVAKYNGENAEGVPVTGNDSALAARIAKLESRIEQREEALGNEAYAQRLENEAQAVAKEFGFDVPQMQAVVSSLIKDRLLGYGGNPDQIRRVLRMGASEAKLPTAKADGQRELLSQVNQKRRAASPVKESTPEPVQEPDVTKMGREEYHKYLIQQAEKLPTT